MTASTQIAWRQASTRIDGLKSGFPTSPEPGSWHWDRRWGGFVIGGPSWRGAWLLVAWTLCYCLQFSTARYLALLAHSTSTRKGARHHGHCTGNSTTSATAHPRADGQQTGYLQSHTPSDAGNVHVRQASHTSQTPHTTTNAGKFNARTTKYKARLCKAAIPTLTYAACTAAVGVPLVVLTPRLLWWAPVMIVLAAMSFIAAYVRKERSLWGNAVAVICASLMCAITSSLGTHHDAQTLVYALTPTLAFAATEYASVLFVKTMIRKHGDSRYYALSMGYHLIVAVLGFAVRPLWGLAACVLLARACALPLIKRRIRPMYIGMVEIATSLMNWLAIVLGAA
ncbi:YwiC-like family protein [Bifidobacterium bombi]|uniref:YwiC-like protein n=1 Tax=Bifidobacterium bombi DSM 19703 TaxID=1341695 RepID=A0A080N4P4_9BIFI|nr:YwiC-like family protein [Bifidobacterium bombi]KFF31585.1 hypothetical protein BBOMB_0968 [Bifidobacterium bombi DSM 19703]